MGDRLRVFSSEKWVFVIRGDRFVECDNQQQKNKKTKNKFYFCWERSVGDVFPTP